MAERSGVGSGARIDMVGIQARRITAADQRAVRVRWERAYRNPAYMAVTPAERPSQAAVHSKGVRR